MFLLWVYVKHESVANRPSKKFEFNFAIYRPILLYDQRVRYYVIDYQLLLVTSSMLLNAFQTLTSSLAHRSWQMKQTQSTVIDGSTSIGNK